MEAGEGLVLAQAKTSSAGAPDFLWYTIPRRYSNLLSGLCDGPLVGLLIPSMARGEDIYVEGPVSERLYHNVSGPYQDLLKIMIPSLERINIFSGDLVRNKARGDGVATGFSAGVDSFSVVADYYFSDVPSSFKLTHLVFNNVGSHGPAGERLFERRFNHVELIADRIGLPLVKINSNLDDFYDESLSFERTHTSRNASVALLLQGGLGRFLYASAFSYPDIKVVPGAKMGHSDAMALPLISTDTLDLISAGGERSRVGKTIQLADFPVTYDALDVCVREDSDRNCSVCDKCMRTLLTLDMAGLINKYEDSFDLGKYRREKYRYIRKMLTKNDALTREILSYANRVGYDFSKKDLFFACLRRPKGVLKQRLRRRFPGLYE